MNPNKMPIYLQMCASLPSSKLSTPLDQPHRYIESLALLEGGVCYYAVSGSCVETFSQHLSLHFGGNSTFTPVLDVLSLSNSWIISIISLYTARTGPELGRGSINWNLFESMGPCKV